MTEQQKKTAGIAITSLVLGIISVLTIWFCGLGALFAIPAVVCGHIGYARIKKSAGVLTGDGMALAGLITGYISIGLLVTIIPIQLAIAIPAFINARNKTQEMSCKNNLRMMDTAIQHYATDNNGRLASGVTQLVGPGAYLKAIPCCPAGGLYTWPSRIDEHVTCSIHGAP